MMHDTGESTSGPSLQADARRATAASAPVLSGVGARRAPSGAARRSLYRTMRRSAFAIASIASIASIALVASCRGRDDAGDPFRRRAATGDASAASPESAAGPSDTARSAGAAPAAIVPPAPPARDADQRFLRQVADHYEALRAAAHDQMSSAAGHAEHGSSVDPAALDVALDAEQRSALALLDTLYQDTYSPRARLIGADTSAGSGVASGSPAAGEDAAGALGSIADAALRGARLAEQSAGRLHRAEVRALAARFRERQRALAAQLTAAASSAESMMKMPRPR